MKNENDLKILRKNLFEYLDGFEFVEFYEIVGAIEDFDRNEVEKNENFTPSYGELVVYNDIAMDYVKLRGIKYHVELD